MTNWMPTNDPLPPDDFHTWARPASPPCPDCECCTTALCELAITKDTACHWEGGQGGDFDVSQCPCWRQGSAARTRIGGAR
jgi:hypothetical protein